MSAAFEARHSVPRLVALIAASLVFVAGGMAMAGVAFMPWDGRQSSEFFGYAAIVFFGAGAFVLGRRLFDRRVQLRIDAHGVGMAHWSEQTIPWSEILRGRIVRVYTRWFIYHRFIGFDLRDPGRFPPASARGFMFSGPASLGSGDITLAAAGLDRSIDDIAAAIRTYAPPGFQLLEE